MAIESIAKTLGTGSGVDIQALVSGLVEASFANRNAQLTAKGETLTAQISKVAELKSAISDFANALTQLTNGVSLATQPTSSNTNILNVTRTPGADLSGLGASVEVRQIAQAQVASTNAFSGPDYWVGTGTLTLTFGTANVSNGAMTSFTAGPASPISISIDSAHGTLDGVAQAINAANTGVTASVLTDSSGSRLVVKGATGASQAFELKGSPQLRELDIGRGESGSTVNAAAQDAIVALDGVETTFPTNSISTLVEGVRLDLVSAAVGTKVTIGARVPTAELSQSVTNFVDTYNEIYKIAKAAVDPVSGPLRGDPAAKDLLRKLKSLAMATLLPDAPAGTPRTLADLGVATQRDGTLRVDSARLAKMMATAPEQVEAMFAAGAGLTTALDAIAAKALDKNHGLGSSETNYAKAQDRLADDLDDMREATEKLRTRMTQQFAAMDAKVAAYKSTQSFLEQQIKAWNAGN